MSSRLPADLEALVAAGDLEQAMKRAVTEGLFSEASRIAESACDFRSAADHAVRAKDFERAFTMLALLGDRQAAETTVAASALPPAEFMRLGTRLALERRFFIAGLLFETGGFPERAADAFEGAGELLRAARLVRAKEPIRAARLLEALLRDAPERSDVRLELGKLLVAHQKWEASVRVLQGIAEGAPERLTAVGELVRAYEALGLASAAEHARDELKRGGGEFSAPIHDVEGTAAATLLFGRYKIQREVASTASARVLEAIDSASGDRVAIKVFAPNDVAGRGRDALLRFTREIELLRALRHPRIVPLLDSMDAGPTIVMPWMAGGTLAALLEHGPLAPFRAVEIATALLDALAAAHRRGILHRDVKPANVLFDGIGAAYLGDFGAAHFGDLSKTATAGLIGSIAYMSPEQRRGEPATIRSDLYAVGAVLYEMLTLRRYSDETNVLPSGVHRDLGPAHDRAVLALLAAAPEERPDDAEAAHRMLRELDWPASIELATARVTDRPEAPPRTTERLVERDGQDWDSLLELPIVRCPLTEEVLARAALFADADHRELQTILRIDEKRNELWLEKITGEPLSRSLLASERAFLREFIGRLHAANMVHGALADSLVDDPRRGLILLFSPTPRGTFAEEEQALARLL